MTRWCSAETPAEDFEQQRERLVRMAPRMLGSSADAEDAVQEARLRLARQDASTIDNLAAWLTPVVARICLDAPRARKVRPESPFEGRLLPELVATEDHCGGVPEEEMHLAESVEVGLPMVLDKVDPPERLAFVLQDLFAMPFHEVGEILDRSTDATKMLGRRARRKLNRTHPPSDVRRVRQDVVDVCWSAARCGDFDDLAHGLDPDALRRITGTRSSGTPPFRAADLRRDAWCRQAGSGRVSRLGRQRRSGADRSADRRRSPPPRARSFPCRR